LCSHWTMTCFNCHWRTVQTWRFYFLCLFIPLLYMFRATKCSSSGESIVSILPLVYVTLCRWPCGVQVWMELFQTCTPHGHLHTVTYTSGCIDTIDSPDVPAKPAHHKDTYIQWHIPAVVLIQLTLLMFHLNLHTTRTPTYSDIYQRSYWYNWLSW